MKKLSFILVCIAALTMVSCGCNSNKKGRSKVADIKIALEDAVDLGLSVKWAICNVGADNMEDVGQYFAWGEVSPKDNYALANYRFSTEGENPQMTKYNADDGHGSLQPEDDAASVVMGEEWRMPTKEEWGELIENCEWEVLNFEGKMGFAGTSKINGSVIFLPLTGVFLGEKAELEGVMGYYWTRDLADGFPSYATQVRLNLSQGLLSTIDSDRHAGLCIRAVKP